jgi:DNA-binding GntR family transcriptional regulator
VIPVAGSGDLPAAVLVDIDDEKTGTYYVHAVAPPATLDELLETSSRSGTRTRVRAITLDNIPSMVRAPKTQVDAATTPSGGHGDSSVHHVVQHLRRGIISGEYPHDTKLLPKAIAERCGTSFIPVREALRILESEGFVVFRHNRGAWVTTLSIADLEDLYELRIDLESEAVRRARPCAARDLELLGDVLDRIHIANQRQDADKVVALNRDFHFLIYRRINSPRRLRMIEQLWLHAERYQHMSVEYRHDAADEEHRQVINLLAAGDHSAAADAMRDHLTSTVNLLRTAFLSAGTRSEMALDAGSP